MSKPESVENYTVEQIRAAFAKHATEDDWGVPKFYEGSLIKALRGEFDEKPKPVFTHDCDECTFLGHRGGFDLYVHHYIGYSSPGMDGTYVARYSSDGPDYRSGKAFVGIDPMITLAHDLATEQGIALNIEEN